MNRLRVLLLSVVFVVGMTIITRGQSSAKTSKMLEPVDPVGAMSIVTSPINGHEEGFTIQVYSFRDHGRADKALAKLKAGGHHAFIEVSDLGDKGVWYWVRVGGLKDEAQTKIMLADIRKEFQEGFVVNQKK